MKLSVGSDEKTGLTDFVVEELKRRGDTITLSGPLKGEAMGWPDVGEKVGMEVSSGRADQGVVFCWTETGVTIAANKVSGIRAALCWDADRERRTYVGRCKRVSNESQKHINRHRKRDSELLVFDQCCDYWR